MIDNPQDNQMLTAIRIIADTLLLILGTGRSITVAFLFRAERAGGGALVESRGLYPNARGYPIGSPSDRYLLLILNEPASTVAHQPLT